LNLLTDIITYVRRLIKSPSNATVTDNLIIDYVNRFYLVDVDARVQLFDMKTLYRFQTSPGIDKYNMPLYNIQTEGTGVGSSNINFYPVYQGFLDPCYINGIPVPFYTRQNDFWNLWPNYLQSLAPATTGNGGATYSFSLPFFPAIPGHVDMSGIIATGSNTDPIVGTTINTNIPSTSIYAGVFITTTDANNNTVVVTDSGQFLTSNVQYGLLMSPGTAPFGYSALTGGYSTTVNTVNYQTGLVNVTFPVSIPTGNNINVGCYFYEPGVPRGIMYYNNTLTVRPPPNISYLVELTAYLTPAAFLNTSSAVPFAYMSEYIARGAARKMLSDTGDWDQFSAYEGLFREQEVLVWKRSQRIFTSTRTQTLFSENTFSGNSNAIGQGAN